MKVVLNASIMCHWAIVPGNLFGNHVEVKAFNQLLCALITVHRYRSTHKGIKPQDPESHVM